MAECAVVQPDGSISAVIIAEVTDPSADGVLVVVPDALAGQITPASHTYDPATSAFVVKKLPVELAPNSVVF